MVRLFKRREVKRGPYIIDRQELRIPPKVYVYLNLSTGSVYTEPSDLNDLEKKVFATGANIVNLVASNSIRYQKVEDVAQLFGDDTLFRNFVYQQIKPKQ